MRIERIETLRSQLGESALWDGEAGLFLQIDMYGRKVLGHDPATGVTRGWDLPIQPGAMALRESGGVVLASRQGIYALDLASGRCEPITQPLFDDVRVAVNDGVVDRAGRFVLGGASAGLGEPQQVGGLFVLDHDGSLRQLDDGIHQSNSHCFDAAGTTLYAADSFTHTIHAYTYDPASGTVADRRLFARTDALGGRPDGATVDADGLVWMAIFEAGKVAAFSPDGRLERTFDVPVRLASSVAFGGPDLATLYVTSIDPLAFGWPAEPGAGATFAVTGLGATGLPEARYQG